jgi:putative transposase
MSSPRDAYARGRRGVRTAVRILHLRRRTGGRRATHPADSHPRRRQCRRWSIRPLQILQRRRRERLFTFTRLPPSQWKSVRTINAIERLHEEFKRRIKTQTVLPSADTAAMLFWALLASGQINMRKVDGWQTLATKPINQPIDLAA